MITQAAFLERLIERLEKAGIPYMVAGSVGSSLHGRPRATQDIDVVIAPTLEQLNRFVDSLGEAYYISREAARDAFQNRTMFNVIDVEAGWKADLIIRKARPFSLQEFQRRRRVEAMGQSLWVVSPEDVILSKLEWAKGRGSDIQFSDALGVAVVHQDGLDQEYLFKWAKEVGVDEDLRRLLNDAKGIADGDKEGKVGGG